MALELCLKLYHAVSYLRATNSRLRKHLMNLGYSGALFLVARLSL